MDFRSEAGCDSGEADRDGHRMAKRGKAAALEVSKLLMSGA
jgi:hypothetical protein